MLSVLGDLGKLEQLVKLDIIQKDGLWQCRPESFAALTANSKLDTLILDFHTTWHLETSAAWEHMFVSGRQLLEVGTMKHCAGRALWWCQVRVLTSSSCMYPKLSQSASHRLAGGSM